MVVAALNTRSLTQDVPMRVTPAPIRFRPAKQTPGFTAQSCAAAPCSPPQYKLCQTAYYPCSTARGCMVRYG